MRHRIYTETLVLIGLMFSAGSATAQTNFTWTGGTGSGLSWNAVSNWNPANVPDQPDEVAIFDVAVAGLTINSSVSPTGVAFNGLGITDPTNISINSGTTLSFTGVSGGQNGFLMNRPGAVTVGGAGTITFSAAAGAPSLNFAGDGTGLLTVQNVITNSGPTNLSLIKTGAHTLHLTGANTFTGPVTINGGVLRINALASGGTASNLGQSSDAAANLVIDGGVLEVVGSAISGTLRSFTIGPNGATLRASGTAPTTNFAASSSVAFLGTGPRTLTLDGSLNATIGMPLNDGPNNTLSVVKNGTGEWGREVGTGNYTGPTVLNAGMFQINALSNAGVASTLGGSTAAAQNLVFNGGTLRVNVSAVVSTDRLFTLGPAGGQINNSDFTAGRVNFTNTGSIIASGTGNRTLFLAGVNTASNNVFTPALTDPAGGGQTRLEKIGIGTWTVNGTSTHTGGTSVSGGVLIVNGNSIGATGTTTVSATLAGAGTLGGPLVSSGIVAPGDNIGLIAGRLTVNGNVTLGGTNPSGYTVNLLGATPGTLHDQIFVTGANRTTTLTTNLNTTISYVPAITDKLFILVNDDPTSTISGTFIGRPQGSSFSLGGMTAFISYQGDSVSGSLLGGNDVVISFQPVPEPGFVLALAGVIALGWRLRRRSWSGTAR
jgi:fibronectin-binding autotransporter adhesin